MDDIANGTQFSDLPSYLVIDILLRLPVKALLICRYVRKDWNRLYFSDPYFIRRQLATSNIQFLCGGLKEGRKFQFGCFVDEESTGNLRMETLDFPCKLKLMHDPKYYWRVVNSCNGLVCLRAYSITASSSVYVCNPILGEWVSIPLPNRNYLYGSSCALGFSVKNNQYKVLLQCLEFEEEKHAIKYEWEIYTLGTGQWRSIEAKETIEPWSYSGLDFNTFIHGSSHWFGYSERGRAHVIQSFDFKTERFTMLSLPEPESYYIEHVVDVTLGVINGCLWASFFTDRQNDDVEMWVMKEYGVEKSWTMILTFRDTHSYDPPDQVLLASNLVNQSNGRLKRKKEKALVNN